MNTSRFALFAAAVWLTSGCGSAAEPSTTTDSGAAAETAITDSGASGDTITSATDSGASGDTMTTPTDTSVTTDAAPSCTPITNVGTAVAKTSVAGPPPAMTGGAITAGTYVLTKFELYNGGAAGSTTNKETFQFGAGTLSVVTSTDGGADKPSVFTYTTAGDTINLTLTCGKMGMLPLKYSATATQFVLVAPTNPNQIQTYTKK